MIEIDIFPASSESKGADAILVRIGTFTYDSPSKNHQTVVLLDSGHKDMAEMIENHLIKYYYTNTIDYVFITHPDSDHISGLIQLLENKKISIKNSYIHDPWNHQLEIFKRSKDGRRTYNSIGTAFDDTLTKLSKTLDLLDNKNEEVFAGYKDEQNGLYILGPSKSTYLKLLGEFPGMENEKTVSIESVYKSKKINYTIGLKHFLNNPETSPKNDSSIIILLTDSDKKPIALFTGDAGVKSLHEAIENAKKMKISVQNVKLMQLPHHGSIKNIDESLIKYISPKSIFVSAPDKDPEHPSQLIINYLLHHGIHVSHINSHKSICFSYDNSPLRPGWTSATKLDYYAEVFPLKDGL